MHDAYVIAVPTLAVIFSALLTRADTNALRKEMHESFAAFRAEFRAELRSELSDVRAEFRSELSGIRAEIGSMRERLARIEERLGIKTAAS